MRLTYIANALSIVLGYLNLALIFPIVVALIFHDYKSILPFIVTGLIAWILSIILKYCVKGTSELENMNDIKKAEALFIVTVSWIMFAIIVAIPYLFYGLGPVDALFESVSGITTTGATILTSYEYPQAFFFWRSFAQWLGGLGIIVLFIAILPQFAVAGRQMFFAEAPGPTEDKLTPRIRNTASALWKIYLLLTVICMFLFISRIPSARIPLEYNNLYALWIRSISSLEKPLLRSPTRFIPAYLIGSFPAIIYGGIS